MGILATSDALAELVEEDGRRVFGGALPGEVAASPARSLRHLLGALRRGKYGLQRVAEGIGIAGIEHVRATSGDLRQAGSVGDQDGDGGGHRLHHWQPKPFVQGRLHITRRAGIQGRQVAVIDVVQEAKPVPKGERREPFQDLVREPPPLSRGDQRAIRALAVHHGDSTGERFHVLPWLESADRKDVSGREGQPGAKLLNS